MARLMTAARLGVVVLLAIAILGAVGTFSFKDVSAAGRAGAAKVPACSRTTATRAATTVTVVATATAMAMGMAMAA